LFNRFAFIVKLAPLSLRPLQQLLLFVWAIVSIGSRGRANGYWRRWVGLYHLNKVSQLRLLIEGE
jgi:hypothetical protein